MFTRSASRQFPHQAGLRYFSAISRVRSFTGQVMSSDGSTLDSENEAVARFHEHLKSSPRIMALLGAGLSASSGLATFRGAGGLWRSYDAISLASPTAFARDPALVWRFYCYRRHKALQAHPNAAHVALAELARKVPGFITLSQNVDGLSQRADHPRESLKLLHGTLFEVKCADSRCGYQAENFDDPLNAALRVDGQDLASLVGDGQANEAPDVDISNAAIPLPDIAREDLPHCPKCERNLLRPNVVWFGEQLPPEVLGSVDSYLRNNDKIDLMMVIGTSAKVYPAAGYIEHARGKGARVCVINMDRDDVPPGGWDEGDFFFQGDAATIVPLLLEPIIGKVGNLDT